MNNEYTPEEIKAAEDGMERMGFERMTEPDIRESDRVLARKISAKYPAPQKAFGRYPLYSELAEIITQNLHAEREVAKRLRDMLLDTQHAICESLCDARQLPPHIDICRDAKEALAKWDKATGC